MEWLNTYIRVYVNVWIPKKASNHTHQSKKEREIIQIACNLRQNGKKIS